ncbi:E3 ubiquitin-protein ligase SIAH1B [Zootermopsis nevadensis]|uniref:RING-type E3 ubiquitin transferase n=1 Tax=Zootermopsis nevadensis TaxID=136037 RepID=A0A067R3R6_ZOONE|nr:E3 ubiquitin-protein ligase SIAH1B [Zootermopsis nevadensis]
MAPDVKGLLEEVECPVCMEYMLQPIAMCVSGHSICYTCREKLLTCPVCRCPFSKGRNLLAENLLGKMRFPCRFSNRGCKKTMTSYGVRKHEDECNYRPFKCPFTCFTKTECHWVGNETSIKNHLRRKHRVPTIDNQHARINSHLRKLNQEYKELQWFLPIIFMDDIFFIKVSVKENNIYFCLQQVELRGKRTNYKYKVSITNKGKTENVVAYNTPKYVKCGRGKIFKEKDCIVFKQEIWKKFLQDDGSLAYEVQIFQNS